MDAWGLVNPVWRRETSKAFCHGDASKVEKGIRAQAYENKSLVHFANGSVSLLDRNRS